jgi:hypothetical protein
LDHEYTSFLSNYNKGSFLISFEHNIPSTFDLNNLLNTVRNLPQIGFILQISLDVAKDIDIPELENLIHKENIGPISKLVNDTNIIGLITHCGSN